MTAPTYAGPTAEKAKPARITLAHLQKLKRTRRDSSRLTPTSSRRNSQNVPQHTRTRQPPVPFSTTSNDPEPSTLFASEEPISQWMRDEISTLPQELRGQLFLTMQTRKNRAAATSDRPLAPIPQEDTAATSQESTVRCMFGSDISASCFAERERARQMDILMVMWSRGSPPCGG